MLRLFCLLKNMYNFLEDLIRCSFGFLVNALLGRIAWHNVRILEFSGTGLPKILRPSRAFIHSKILSGVARFLSTLSFSHFLGKIPGKERVLKIFQSYLVRGESIHFFPD